MPEKTKTNSSAKNIDVVRIDASSSPEDLALLKQYFKIRQAAFPDTSYTDSPSARDIDPQNPRDKGVVYILGKVGDKVIGGSNYFLIGNDASVAIRRTPLRTPGHNRIKGQVPAKYLKKEGLIPADVTYIELAGLSIDPKYQRQGYSRVVSDKTMELASKEADFLIAYMSSENLVSGLKSGERAGLNTLILTEDAMLSGVGVLGLPMLFSRHPHIFDNMRNDGIGMPREQFIKNIEDIEKRHDLRNRGGNPVLRQNEILDELMKKNDEYRKSQKATGPKGYLDKIRARKEIGPDNTGRGI